MNGLAEMLKPTEAAVVASVELRDIHRVIDERILPEGFVVVEDGRRIAATACMLIAFYFDSAKRLTSEERLLAIRQAGQRLRGLGDFASLVEADWILRDDYLAIDLAPFFQRAKARMDRLTAARDMVVSDPDVLGGAPVVRGTRVLVHDLAASVAAGLPVERIASAYPSLDARKIELAALYAEANPARGRPRASENLPVGAVVVADRRVARRKKAGRNSWSTNASVQNSPSSRNAKATTNPLTSSGWAAQAGKIGS